jgi:short-subunit dehydrogenase
MATGATTAWSSQVALITGAGSGLGRQLALLLATDGLAIAAVDVRTEGLQTLGKELEAKGTRVAWEVADVTDPVALQKAVSTLETRLGPVDLLIASAGIGQETSALAFDATAFAANIGVNLLGVANSAAAVLPGMLARGRGHLVAISSLASYRGLPLMAGYCASKSGVNALMEALRIEIGPRGICTSTVCPGWIRTPMTERLALKESAMLDVDDAARRVVRAIRKRRAFTAFPRSTRSLVAVMRWLPAGLSDWMLRRVSRAVDKHRK